MVDAPVPPLDVLEEIFVAAGVPAPPTTPLPWGESELTFAGNCNGGPVPDPRTPAARPGAGLGDVGPLVARPSRTAARLDLSPRPGRHGPRC